MDRCNSVVQTAVHWGLWKTFLNWPTLSFFFFFFFFFFCAIGFRGNYITTICVSEIWGSPGCFHRIPVSYKWQHNCSETCCPPSLSHSHSQSPPSSSPLSPPSLSKSQVTVAGVFRHLWLVFPLCPCPCLQPGKSHPVPSLIGLGSLPWRTTVLSAGGRVSTDGWG